jgi:hypothetical protein
VEPEILILQGPDDQLRTTPNPRKSFAAARPRLEPFALGTRRFHPAAWNFAKDGFLDHARHFLCALRTR